MKSEIIELYKEYLFSIESTHKLTFVEVDLFGLVLSLQSLNKEISKISVSTVEQNVNIKKMIINNSRLSILYKIKYKCGSEKELIIMHRVFNNKLKCFMNSLVLDLFLIANFNSDSILNHKKELKINSKCKFLLNGSKFFFCRVFNRFFYRDEWKIKLFNKYIKIDDVHLNFNDGISVKNDKGFFLADPFLIKFKSDVFVFYEKCKLNKGKGYISCRNLRAINIEYPVLEEDYHLSYPNIFEFKGELYLIPQSDNKCIDLYKCIDFPSKWNKVHTIATNEIFYFADTNIKINNDEDIVLTTSIYKNVSDSNRCLIELRSKDLVNDKLNISEARLLSLGDNCSRNAGNVDGIYQDSSITYGGGMVRKTNDSINAIVNPKHVNGFHTYNVMGDYTVVDYKVKKFGFYI